VFCTRCGHENPEDSRFCAQCGAPLTRSGENLPAVEATSIISGGFEELPGPELNEDAHAGAVDALPPGSALLVV
jgi:hypothetical protein